MYPEFVPIYVGLIVIIILLIVILCCLIIRTKAPATMHSNLSASAPVNTDSKAIVFCKNCATQYDASQRCCPKCGTPR